MRETEVGFTIVEVMVSLIILAMFTMFFFQMYLMMESQRVLVQRRATASDIAYKNLRKFPALAAVSAVECNSNGMANTNGGQVSSGGLLLGDQGNTSGSPSLYGFVAENTSSLGSSTTQKVVAYAPFGCGDGNRDILQIVSTVRFNGEDIRHVAYIKAS